MWTTRAGQRIPVTEMTDDHLRNTILFLRRAHARYVEDMTKNPPPMFNGEMAQFYADQEWDEALMSSPEDLYPIYVTLVHEYAFRVEKRARAHRRQKH